jgi:hypothetical protein
MPSPQTVKRVLLTGAVAAVTVTGTLYGAGLKMNQEVKQVIVPASCITLSSPSPIVLKTPFTLEKD